MKDVDRRAIEDDWTLRAKIYFIYLRSESMNDYIKLTLFIQEKEFRKNNSYSDKDKVFYI